MAELSNSFWSIPDSSFFLRHVVNINYAGKVFVVLRAVELLQQVSNTWYWSLLMTYGICMLLGMYWYTRFWHKTQDLTSFYTSESSHALNRFGPKQILFGASMFYLLFVVLFFIAYGTGEDTALVFGAWNTWCWLNLLMAVVRP